MATFLACILSGVLLVLAFPKPDLGLLAWVALAPLFWAIEREERPLVSAGAALAGGWVFYAGLLYWIYPTCRAGGAAVPLALAAWLALAAVLALDWGVLALVLSVCRRLEGGLTPGLIAMGWVAMEFVRERWTTRFPWGLLGYTQWRHPWLLQIVSATGVYGLSFIVVLVNAALALSFRPRPKSSPKWRLWVSSVLALGLALGLGAATFARIPKPGNNLTVAFLQPNIDQYKKWDKDYVTEIRSAYESQVDESGGAVPPNLVLWPESAVPGWMDEKQELEWVAALARRTRAFNIIGAVTRAGGQNLNAAFLLSPEGSILGMYGKRHLVPFGEYVPLRSLWGASLPILSQLGEFDAGDAGQAPLRSFLGAFAVSICYEAIFPDLIRNPVEDGSRFLVNLTNDGWYLDTAGPYQHFAMSVLRAPENRAYLFRAANTGISAVVDPYGRVLARTALNERSVLRAEVPMGWSNLAPSLYSRLGDLFAGLCVAGFSVLALAALFVRKAR